MREKSLSVLLDLLGGYIFRPDPSSLCIPGTICFPHHEFEPWCYEIRLLMEQESSACSRRLKGSGGVPGGIETGGPGGPGVWEVCPRWLWSFGSGSCCNRVLRGHPPPAGCSQKCLWSLHPTGQTRPLALWPWDCGALWPRVLHLVYSHPNLPLATTQALICWYRIRRGPELVRWNFIDRPCVPASILTPLLG